MPKQIDTAEIALDFSQGSDTIELSDVPLGVELLRTASLELRDKVLENQFNAEMGKLTGLINDAVKSERAGYLLKVEIFVDQAGTPSVPSGQLVMPIGLGREPLDAYSEFLNRDIARGPKGKGIDSSTYIWVRRSTNGLKAIALHRAENNTFEANGLAEARRRRLIGNPAGQDVRGYKVIRRALLWSEIEKRQLLDLQSENSRDQVSALTRRMEETETRFNAAYRSYQESLLEAARKAEHQKVLEGLGTVFDVLKAGIGSGLLCSPSGVPANADGEPTVGNDANIRSTKERINQLTNEMADTVPRVNELGQTLKQIDIDVRSIYEKEGIPIPYFDPLRDSDVTIIRP